jgi:hypothetical protein
MNASREHKAEQLAELLNGPVTDVRQLLERLTTFVLDSFSVPRQQRLFRVLMSDGLRLAKQGRINLIERMTSGAAPLHDLMRRLSAHGTLLPRDPEVLTIEFMGPLLLWRHWHAIHPGGPLVKKRKAFIREHVDHFLEGATAPPARRLRAGFPDAVPRAGRAAAARPRARSKAVS